MSTPSSMVGEQNRAASRPARERLLALDPILGRDLPGVLGREQPASVGARSA